MANLYIIALLYFVFKIYQTGKLSADRGDFLNRFIRKYILSKFNAEEREKSDQKAFGDAMEDFEEDMKESKIDWIRNNSHLVKKLKLVGTAKSRYLSAAVGLGALVIIIPAVGFIWWHYKLYLHDYFGPSGEVLVNIISAFLLLPASLVVLIIYAIISLPIAALGEKK
jgi:hypothetical protein